jgi:CRISPR system Cascade subunit CasC
MSDNRTVFVEFHALTSYAPSNLNRDDLGSPKTALFGGVRRLRISSQCLKRTWRTSSYFTGQLSEELLGVRTSRLPEIVRHELTSAGVGADVADGLVALLQALGKKEKKDEDEEDEDDDPKADRAAEAKEDTADAAKTPEERTAHLLFLSRQEIDEVKRFAIERQAKLREVYEAKPGKGGKPGKVAKKQINHEKVGELRKLLKAHLGEKCKRNAVDVALFGRFLTSDEFAPVDAAMQVAHGLGTQKVEVEYDYFTAMDDRGDEPGAGHLGETEFAASVLYSYAACDLRALRDNVGGEQALAARGLRAVALAIARAVPRGKKNSTAPQNPADYLEVVVRRDAPISLANAFLDPVRPGPKGDVMVESIQRLRKHADVYQRAYTNEGDVLGRFVLCLRDVGMPAGVTRVERLDELASQVEALAAGVPLP